MYRENTRDDLKVVGKVNAGWPSETLVAATSLRGNGLAPVLTAALNSAIKDGSYAKVLERWGLSEEALPESKTVTTYEANRSLSVVPAADGTVHLDFNRAVNLPCAYTDLATCPLPPAENRLPVAIEAGEKIPYERQDQK